MVCYLTSGVASRYKNVKVLYDQQLPVKEDWKAFQIAHQVDIQQ